MSGGSERSPERSGIYEVSARFARLLPPRRTTGYYWRSHSEGNHPMSEVPIPPTSGAPVEDPSESRGLSMLFRRSIDIRSVGSSGLFLLGLLYTEAVPGPGGAGTAVELPLTALRPMVTEGSDSGSSGRRLGAMHAPGGSRNRHLSALRPGR